jgi:P4 family phage/plasmid primase-like protien
MIEKSHMKGSAFAPVPQKTARISNAPKGREQLEQYQVRDAERLVGIEEVFDPEVWTYTQSMKRPDLTQCTMVRADGLEEVAVFRVMQWEDGADAKEPLVLIPPENVLGVGRMGAGGLEPGTKMSIREALTVLRYDGDGERADQHLRATLAGLNRQSGIKEIERATTAGTAVQGFVAQCGHEIMFARTGESGTWFSWKNERWVESSIAEIATQFASRYISLLCTRGAWQAMAKSIDTNAMYRQCVAYAQGEPSVSVNTQDIDSNPELLGTPKGLVDLRTGQLMPALPKDRVTRCTSVAPDFSESEPWLAFLDWAMSGEQSRIDYLQEALGMSVVGLADAEKFFVCTGDGANGKTVLLEVIRGVLGDTGSGGYAQNAPRGFLVQGLDRHQTEIARLEGARFVTVSETGNGDSFDEDKVKNLASANQLTANKMRQDHRNFTPTHTMWLATNFPPRVKDGGHSFFRRARFVEFKETVPEDQQDNGLARRLVEEEGERILAWLIEGARRYLEHKRLPQCDEIDEATNKYRLTQDSVTRFVQGYTVLGPKEWVRGKPLHDAYEEMCEIEGEVPLGRGTFLKQLRDQHGIEKSSDSKYRGIDINHDAFGTDDA